MFSVGVCTDQVMVGVGVCTDLVMFSVGVCTDLVMFSASVCTDLVMVSVGVCTDPVMVGVGDCADPVMVNVGNCTDPVTVSVGDCTDPSTLHHVTCLLCFVQVQGILHHQQTMHQDLLPDVTVLDYEEITLPIHMQQRTYSCKLCPYKSESKEEVEKHYSLHCSQANFVCDHCPFTTKVKEEIVSHVHSHNASTATDPSSKGFSLVLDASSPIKTSPTKYPLQTPPIKQEPMSFSPPHASTPVQDPSQPAPLDLSTEPADDRKDINSKAISLPVQKPDQCKERMDLDEDDANDVGAASEKAAQLTTACSQEKAADDEAREIMEAEAANDTDKVSTEAAAVGEKQVRVYKCKHCPYSSSSNFEFRSHCSFHGLKGRFECDYCTYSHGELANITQHRQLHSHQPGYNPDYKPQPSPEESTLKGEDGTTPTASPRPTSTPAPEMLECPDCPYRTSLRKSYNIHVGMHGQRQHYICDFCDWSADRLVILVQHRIIHDKEPDFDSSPKDSVFINPEYPKPKDVPGEFEAKLLDSRSSEESPQAAASSDTQSPPFKLSITKKLYTCPQCPYVTANRTAYDYHLGLHGGPGCFACEQCSYHTDRWGLYCQHSRLHEEQKAPSPAPQPSKADKADGSNHSSPAATPGVLPSEKSYDGDAAAGKLRMLCRRICCFFFCLFFTHFDLKFWICFFLSLFSTLRPETENLLLSEKMR